MVEVARFLAVAARAGFGGTAPERVSQQAAELRQVVDRDAAWATR